TGSVRPARNGGVARPVLDPEFVRRERQFALHRRTIGPAALAPARRRAAAGGGWRGTAAIQCTRAVRRPILSEMTHNTLSSTVALVTGAAGFIGSALSSALGARGLEVHTVSRRAWDASPGVRHWRVDLSDASAAADLVKSTKPHYVFHLASHVMGAPDLHHVLPAFQSNLQTTVNLLSALAQTDCGRMIITGSLVEPENGARTVPNSPYAAAKWAASDYARMFHALYGFPVAIARVFMVYGPGQQDDTKLVPYVIRCVLRNEAPKITSGKHCIDWIYVDDVVSGLMQLAAASGVDGKSVDFGS